MHFLSASLATFLITILSLAFPILATSPDTCSRTSPTIFVDIHFRLVDGRTDFFQYGLFIGLGTPSQNNSLWPAITHNETVFSAPDYCSLADSSSTTTTSACGDNFHGFIATESSSTWREEVGYEVLDDESTVQDINVLKRGMDTLNVWTHYFDPSPATGTYVQDFPVGIASNYSSSIDPFFGPGGTFGLGPSSTGLDLLYKDNYIGTRSYGLYLGTKEERAGGTQNGSIVFGGYDSGRFTGPVLEYEQVSALAVNSYSPFKVSVSQVALVTKQGQNIALVTDGAFDAYLTSSQFPVQLPTTVTQRLADALKAEPANNDDNTLKTSNGFDGNLTITLSNNLTFTFDSSWISNASNISPISAAPLQVNSSNATTGSSPEGTTLPILLGASFLEQVYLFVQYDSTPPSFSLAQALPYGQYVQPEPFCPGMLPAPAVAPTINAFEKKGLTGAILGGLIGGGALSVLAWVIFGGQIKTYLRRNSRPKGSDHDKPAMTGSLRTLKDKTRRAVRFGSSRKDTFEYRDMETGRTTTPKAPQFTVTAVEVEKFTLPTRSPASSTKHDGHTPTDHIRQQDENIEMSPLSKSGLTILTPNLSADTRTSINRRSENIVAQEANYPPTSARSDKFNDVSLATPIPPTPHSAMPLLDQGQSGWPSQTTEKHSRRPTLTIRTASTTSATRPGESSIPTFVPLPVQQQTPKSKLKTLASKMRKKAGDIM